MVKAGKPLRYVFSSLLHLCCTLTCSLNKTRVNGLDRRKNTETASTVSDQAQGPAAAGLAVLVAAGLNHHP